MNATRPMSPAELCVVITDFWRNTTRPAMWSGGNMSGAGFTRGFPIWRWIAQATP